RVDDEAIAKHGADLPFERQVVEILRERDCDGEVHRVATAWNDPEGTRRGLDACAAFAVVLLALDLAQHELALDDVDVLGVVALARPLLELASACLAGAISDVEFEGRHLDHFEKRLLPWPVPLLRSLVLALFRTGPLFR